MSLPRKSGIIQNRIVFFREDSWPVTATFKRGGNAVDLTGATANMVVNTLENPDTGTPGTVVMTVAGVILGAPTDGNMTFTPTTVDTDQTPGTYYCDFELTEASGDVQTFMKMEFEIIQDIGK